MPPFRLFPRRKIKVAEKDTRMEQTISPAIAASYPRSFENPPVHNEAHSSGVSWSAVIAGGFVTAALALILLALGTGLGLSSVSLWSNTGASVSTVSTAAIVWLILMQIVSASMGGYLAGRLRTKWATLHNDEVYFRDTAHGFLSWSVALVITAAFLASAATSLVGSSSGAAPVTKSATVAPSDGYGFGANDYFIDSLLRSDSAKTETGTATLRNEAGVIFITSLKQGEISQQDKNYLDQLVMARTGLSQGDADKRVTDVFASAQQAAEATRKAVAHSLLWAFVALLIGAFCASFSATIGGRQRDHVVTI
jgi:hypothetical protein